MSDVADKGKVRLWIADYAAADGAGKLTLVGANVTVLGQAMSPNAGLPLGFTAPFCLVVLVQVPPALYGAEAALEVVLEDSVGDVVSLPGPAGEPQLMRVAQNVVFEEPQVRQLGIPRKTLPASVQVVLNFNTGLPLSVGQLYRWHVRLDGDSHDDWSEVFYVPGTLPGPVIG